MYTIDVARRVQAQNVGRSITVRIGWILAIYLILLAAQLQGWIDLPTWVFWLLGVPVALLVLLAVTALVLQRVLARRFRRLFQQTSEQMRAWQEARGGRAAQGDVVEGEVVEEHPGADGATGAGSLDPFPGSDDEPVRIEIEDGEE